MKKIFDSNIQTMVLKVGKCCTTDPSNRACSNLGGKCNCPSQTTCPRTLTSFENNVKTQRELYLSAVSKLSRLSWQFRNGRISFSKFKSDKAHYEDIRDSAAATLASLKANKLAMTRSAVPEGESNGTK